MYLITFYEKTLQNQISKLVRVKYTAAKDVDLPNNLATAPYHDLVTLKTFVGTQATGLIANCYLDTRVERDTGSGVSIFRLYSYVFRIPINLHVFQIYCNLSFLYIQCFSIIRNI